ncbi:hypothetical protein BDV10DRAFT_184079 [Aspergillus recurvatus]
MPLTIISLRSRLNTLLFERPRDKAHRLSGKSTHWSDLDCSSTNAQGEWISDHIELESRSVAILQRISRLDSVTTSTNENNDNVTNVNEEKKGGLTTKEKETLYNAYYDNNRLIKNHWATKPPGNTTTAFELDNKNFEPGTGRRAQWFNQRVICAERGGRCGRVCGCCEKPLSRYIIVRVIESGRDKGTTVPVYGHCVATGVCLVIAFSAIDALVMYGAGCVRLALLMKFMYVYKLLPTDLFCIFSS